ncbi:MAG: hypothetical protein AAF490_07140 [Chloroflexota bacterium]
MEVSGINWGYLALQIIIVGSFIGMIVTFIIFRARGSEEQSNVNRNEE